MDYRIALPGPARLRPGGAVLERLAAGTRLHRIHPARYGAAQFNDSARGNARFSPLRDAAGTLVPTLYAGEGFDCAAAEIILRSPDLPATDPATGLPPLAIAFPADFTAHAHSEVTLARDLRLVDLGIAGQRGLGVDHNALLGGPMASYPATRAWAAAIHAALPEAEGLIYPSHQLGPARALMLFGDRAGDAVIPGPTRPVAGAACHAAILALADRLGMEYIDL
ncbi:RES domain-containing protein [Mangrovicoccus algicola]|uniref:RES family NAD+ phosphorylase n=1 Tax=Mangrovicoccus algicola TaxID=2771008 RepID=A0A8J6YYS4_9RHOB|nr:RES domain-containing protein [Mangrovicoccus algicola]MBE3640457.1 RES family NAD+ phosphorylase [Mangrovicoccus algicola]